MQSATRRSWCVFLLLLACERSAEERGASPSDSTRARVLGAASTAVPIGQFAETSYFRMRVHEQGPCLVEDYLKPAKGLRRLGVEVTLEATGAQGVPANPFYATLETREGNRFESTLAGCRPVLEAEQLQPGQSTRGWLSFDVPESEVPAQLRYEPLVLGAGRQTVLLSLEP